MRIYRINELKKARNMTNQQLADKANISISTLSKIMYGISDNPSMSTMQAIADALECSVDEFADKSDIIENYQFTNEEIDLIEKYRKANNRDKELIKTILNNSTPEPEYEYPTDTFEPMMVAEDEVPQYLSRGYDDNELTIEEVREARKIIMKRRAEREKKKKK